VKWYVYRCPDCGATWEDDHQWNEYCVECGSVGCIEYDYEDECEE